MDKKIYNAVSKRAGGRCEVCHKGGRLELHHILRRKVPATINNCIMLCPSCHRGSEGVHGMLGHLLDITLKQKLQKAYFEQTHDEDKTRELMGGRLYDISN